MDQSITNLCASLDALAAKIIAGHSTKTTLAESWGWHHPAITRQELAHIPASISQKLKDLNPNTIDADLKSVIDSVPARIAIVEAHNLPYFYNGNGHYAIPAFLTFCNWLNTILQPLIGWTIMNDPKSMPLQLSKKLKAVQSQLEEIVESKDDLVVKVTLINEAHVTAENLPVDLEALREARKKIDVLHVDSAGLSEKIKDLFKNSTENELKIKNRTDEADRLVSQCEEAYKITTTKGLAGAFDQRAKSLNYSMIAWIGGLLLALVAAAVIGSTRVTALTKLLEVANPSMLVVWTNLILSIFSIAAPVWFAWIATKQISQRFKLVEDYAFKSSIAKAYEGYRREAARIDPEFESRLFASTLSRLEELPLRVMEQKNYGSPWQEMLNWPEFKEAIKAVPELGNKVLSKVSKRSEDLEK